MGKTSLQKRSEIPEADTWDLTALFPSDEAWEKAFREAEAKLPQYGTMKGRLGQSTGTLYDCLSFDDELSLEIERLYVYAKQKSDEDTGNQTYQDYSRRALSLSYQAGEKSSYIVPEILAMKEDTLAQYRREDERLSHYDRTFERLMKKKAHTLPADMEELLAQSHEATEGSSQIFNMFQNADVRFPEITGPDGELIRITHGNFIALMQCGERKVRKDAFEALYAVYRQYGNTLAATLEAHVKQAVFYAKARRYASSREYYLAENEIPLSVYDQLLEAVHDGLPLLHRYMAVRRQALGVEQLHMYDIYVPMVENAQEKISFEEAKQMVMEGLEPLGAEYSAHLREGLENRWIDIYENEGKRNGAYSWGAYGAHPYVLLNYNGTLDSVFTLAHEMGHALHSWYSDHNQTYVDAGYKIFVAEVASTCNEALLIRHMLKKAADSQEKKYLINHFLESFRTTLYRQAMFAEFEAGIHRRAEEGIPLTKETLCGFYRELNEAYFGPEMEVDEEIGYEWARIPHFYTPFYVYQYATGFSAAVAISSRILAGDEETLAGYFRFLGGGCSMTPIGLLKLCGVDMTTSGPVREALGVFEELLEEYQSLT